MTLLSAAKAVEFKMWPFPKKELSALRAAIRATEERQEKCDHENRRLIRNSGQLLGGPGDYRVTDNQCCPKCGKSLIEKETEEVKT